MRGKAQVIMEYAVLIGVLVAGLIAMQVYIKRSTQGRLRSYTDQLGGNFYSPRATTSHSETINFIREHSNSTGNISENNAILVQENERSETIKPLDDEPQRW